MLDRFYTYSRHDDDLHIHAWDFVEKNDDGLHVYHNAANNKDTTVIPYDNEDDFCRENDVFESRLEIVLNNEDTFTLDEVRMFISE